MASGSQQLKLYCPNCQQDTPHTHLADAYATQCNKCAHVTSQLERMNLGQHTVQTPNGEAKVVSANNQQVVFEVDKPKSKIYYTADLKSGYGGITEIPK